MKKKIALDICTSHRGGPYISTLNLINSSLKEKYEFITFDYDAHLGKGISFKRILNITKQLKEIQPDIVLFSGLQLSGFIIAIATKLAKVKKSIVVIHGSSLEAINFAFWKKIILFILEFFTLHLVDAFYGVSKYSSKISATRFFPQKNKGFVYNLPTLGKQTFSQTKEDYGFKYDDIIVASSGRITKEKGFELITKIIKCIKQNQIKFLIIGDGEYLEEMRSELREEIRLGKVVFTGFSSEVMSLLSFCDIFILATLHETLSISLLEAASAGLPIVATDVGGIPEVVEHNKNGFLIEKGNCLEFVRCINYLASSKKLRIQLGKNGKQRIDKLFSHKIITEKLCNLIEDVINT